MKTGFEKETPAPRGNTATLAVFVLCLGLGVTGTLLWLGKRPKPPVVAVKNAVSNAVSRTVPAAPEVGDILGVSGVRISPSTVSPLPPAELTAGMSKRQTALTLANWYYDHHQHSQAVKNFRRAIDLGVTHPNVRTDYGNALRLNGQPQEALKQYQIAQKQDPTHELSLFNQGALYEVSLKNPQKAVAVWRTYLTRFPKGANAAQARKLIAKFAGKK